MSQTATAQPEPPTDRDPRKCTHVYDDGRLCNGWATQGTGLCGGHRGLGLAADPSTYGAQGAAATNAQAQERAQERRDKPKTLKEALAKRLEDRADAITNRYESIALGSTSDAASLTALDQWISRVHGRPTEHVETTVVAPASLEALRELTVEQRAELLNAAPGKRLALVEDESKEETA